MPEAAFERREARSIVAKAPGRLHVVATPIGNLADLSPRARETLAGVDVIAAEDTRHTSALLQAVGLSRPLVSLHEHNESARIPELLARLEAGECIALVSDAGTPLLSDPGYELIRAAAQRGLQVLTVPGPSAITAALAVAGLATDRFCFEGFLPSRDSERRARLSQLAAETRTLVFFEAPHRIAAMLRDLGDAFGSERLVAVARELTKMHETVYRGAVSELVRQAETEAHFARGEITVVVQGAPKSRSEPTDAPPLSRVVALLIKELPPAKAASIAAKLTGASRADAYALALKMSE